MSEEEKDIWQAFEEVLSRYPEDALADLKKDDLPKEPAIKYYTQGFEDARLGIDSDSGYENDYPNVEYANITEVHPAKKIKY